MNRIVNGNSLRFVDDNGGTVAELVENRAENNVWLVHLKGSISNDCAYDVSDELFALISVENGIILDMSETTYVSSTFAEMLVQLQIKMENTDFESMPIQNMPSEIFRSLKERGCITSLDYELKED